jgi:hypothetical protein
MPRPPRHHEPASLLAQPLHPAPPYSPHVAILRRQALTPVVLCFALGGLAVEAQDHDAAAEHKGRAQDGEEDDAGRRDGVAAVDPGVQGRHRFRGVVVAVMRCGVSFKFGGAVRCGGKGLIRLRWRGGLLLRR